MEDEEAKAAQPQPTPASLKLRNYVPVENKAFDYVRVEAAKAASANLTELAQQKKVEGEEEEDLVAQGGTVSRVAVPEEDVVEVDVVRTANLKENWDLKRDVEKKLKRLERRTQQAMVELMREEEIGRQKSQLQQ
ncbi:cwf18 pre-mRNA splicing factor [Chloropicon roscoffensis]|uniref:Cwf18 pre-mRNA splicing factor n=1 Tax=Chloropicon roscoffensis TaxID=1461544 RepID=A0AAX4P6P2_9CHLO